MKILNLNQGSQEWLDARKSSFNASEASAMMGDSKHMSRNDLLQQKKTGISKPINAATQRIFDLGHQYEDEARLVISMEQCEELPPLVGLIEIDGLKLLASFDGLTDGYCWEHKSWNKTLAENVLRQTLEPHYYWQLEHQMLVADVPYTLFTVSNGKEEQMVTMVYDSVPERRAQLIEGWKQFKADLENYEAKAKVEIVKPAASETLPSVTYSVTGTEISTNINDCLLAIKDLAEFEMSKTLESDQDFANKEQLNKDVKKARAALKATVASVQGEFISYSQFAEQAAELDSVLQQMQSQGEKQVKQEKEARKQSILNNASKEMTEFLNMFAGSLDSNVIHDIAMQAQPDFVGVMKGKRTIDSLQNAVDDELARCKITITPLLETAASNDQYYNDNASGFEFLFRDINQLLTSSREAFESIINTRIEQHKKSEQERLDQERERIRIEEEAKAKRKAEAETVVVEEAAKPVMPEVMTGTQLKEITVNQMETYPLESVNIEITAWEQKYDIPFDAVDELKEIIARYI